MNFSLWSAGYSAKSPLEELGDKTMCALTRAIPLVAWLLFAGTVQAAPIVDQQHTPFGNFPAFAVANDRTQIQTFTVGITGAITRIDVQVSRGPLTVENLVLSL
jgi:hypothetical protein